MAASSLDLTVTVALSLAVLSCASDWQGAEAVDARPHVPNQSPQPATAIAGGKAIVVWNRALIVGTSTLVQRTWARVHDGSDWSSFTDLGSDTPFPQVAGSADGTAIALVSDGAVRYDGAGWSAPVPLALDEAPSLAMDGSGRAMVVGSSGGSTRAVLFAPSSGWSDGVNIGAAGRQYRVAMNAAGAAVVAWCQGSEVWANVYGLDGSWTGAQLVLNGCVGGGEGLVFGTTALDVAMTGTGQAHIATAATRGIFVTTYSPITGFGTATIADAVSLASFPQMASDSHGNALLVWTRLTEGRSIWASYYRPGRGWAGPLAVAASSTYSRKGLWLDDSGTGQVAYIQRGGGDSVYASEFNGSALAFLAPVSLEPLGGSAYYLSGAGTVGGDGVVAWNADGVSGGPEQIWANRYVP